MINSLMLEDGGPHSVKVHTHLMPKLGLDLRLGDVTLENLMLVFDQAPEFVRGQLLNLALYGLSKTFGFIMGFVLVFYLGTGLYRENRDRSVMFWKSMPVSDSAAIFSRLVVAFPIILAILLATVILAQFIVLGVFTIPAWLAGLSAWKLLWGPPYFLHLWSHFVVQFVVDSFWFLPGVGLILVLNSWAPRNRWVFGLLPLGALFIDKIFFGTKTVWLWMVRHLLPPGIVLGEVESLAAAESFPSFDHFAEDLANLDFWTGIFIGAVLIAWSIWIRRWREES